MTTSKKLHVLSIVNGDPRINAGARLRVTNWVESLPNESRLEVCIIRRPRYARKLFRQVQDWLHGLPRVDTSSCEGGMTPVVIVQKAFSLDMVALLLYLRLLGVAVVQDVCDPPIKNFNPEPFSKTFFAVFYLSLISHYLVDQITVSSSVLARSFSAAPSPVDYIPDCIDFQSVSSSQVSPSPLLSYPNPSPESEMKARPVLHLLWFGGAARPQTYSGIEELYAATDILEKLATRYRVRLSVCTIFESDTLPFFQFWASQSTFLDVDYYEWSLPAQEYLLSACDLCFLPRLQSLATFYKSPNRTVLAAFHGRRTLSNMVPSEDYDGLALLTVADLLPPSGSTIPSIDRLPALEFPSAWTADVLCREWEKVILSTQARCSQRPGPTLAYRLSLTALLFILRVVTGYIDFNKSRSIRNRSPIRQLRRLRNRTPLRQLAQFLHGHRS